MESVESQKQASHSFHEPLGNLAKRRRDSHIPTAPATKADGKVENQRQVSHFPTASIPLSLRTKQNRSAGGLRAAPVVPFCSAEVGNFHSALDRMDELEKARNFIAHNRMLLPSEFQRLYMYIADWNRVIGL